MTQIIVLGATGSVGETAFRVLQHDADRIRVDGLVAHSNFERLWEMGTTLHANWVGLTDTEAAMKLRAQHGSQGPRIIVGFDAILEEIASSPAEKVIGAMTGFAGLLPTLTAIRYGKDILLANKETMVAAGDLVRQAAKTSGSHIIPVDSEHSAIFQCLALDQPLRRIVLTCSGGPFRGRTRKDLVNVRVEDALKHPNWAMGAKITVDSATLMNKGLEIIEAHHLFDVTYDQIDVVIHPQSVVHSLVEFVDGATMAQLGWPDMAVPVQVALSWPERWPLPQEPLDLTRQPLTFEPPDTETFESLRIAREAGRIGGLVPTVLNAANEVAVSLFLSREIGFLSIIDIIKDVLQDFRDNRPVVTLEDILDADQWARQDAVRVARRYQQ
ncbi:1-deoxy-D-xylulose-5-phosphate reductoisomerase [Sulfobacillus thermosulfidooxidans]|uniref:1-deoxy-D-xylulose-5-phosphate reductoisomerase n=1 Tax=Sulfobacillus thermosulfidooxidans TaxID=28034 RepID=UPI00096BA147|nr:1-deoxy-D-xylulose-5-phosphate reductoisomerase [Sulfobacillus thermosulfidooxidans]OLZ12263.1 1-deoxy-D-xylulose-5-phosphate reductoisomerase [Sulfobacillus thermosulfidooxidans]OLZ12956.1 1-deoxy-D-xylulose-5-phosphate reductoisomerase [Sulfobacillus thermosulfidooxidans]OLZ21757.1 1-deoxy-D-xylulose-5-phosphate reductoisomerase [Sulfobacillus thermosulfidooxidans]